MVAIFVALSKQFIRPFGFGDSRTIDGGAV